jgi:hypothetical protein
MVAKVSSAGITLQFPTWTVSAIKNPLILAAKHKMMLRVLILFMVVFSSF